MERIDGAFAINRQQPLGCINDALLGFLDDGMIDRNLVELRLRQVVSNRVRNDEVAVRQALHQCAGPQAIRPVVGKVRLAQREQAWNGGLEIVVDPQAAHRVMDGRIDAHRRLIRILTGDPLIHVEQIAVALTNGVLA